MANVTWSTTDKSANLTLSGGNLIITTTSNAVANIRTTDRQITGKFYWENTFTTITGQAACGIGNQLTASLSPQLPASVVYAIVVTNGGQIDLNGTTGASLGVFSAGGVACFAVDVAAQLFWIRNGAAGNWNGAAANNPATGVGGLVAPFIGGGIPAYPFAAFSNGSTTGSLTANFGDSAFTGAVPAGFTSGFTSGAVISTNAVLTQTAIEHWATVL